MGDRRRRQHIGRSRSGGGGCEHEAAAQLLLGVGDGRHRHRLLVLTPAERQGVTISVKRFAEANDVAMAKNAETASAKPQAAPVDLDILGGEMPDERLGHRQTEASHRFGHGSARPSLDARA